MTKPKALKSLVGKPIMLLHKRDEAPDGPFILTGFEYPFLCVLDPKREKEFWFNAMLIDSFREADGEK